MRRWCVDFWKAPVLANDIGYISFRNPYYVLDVWGLASSEALERRNDRNSEWMNDLSKRYGAECAVVYPRIQLPGNWTLLASMYLSRRRISIADKELHFYAANERSMRIMRRKLLEYRKGLPDGVNLEIGVE